MSNMDDNLKDATLLIGKESLQNKLCLVLLVEGMKIVMTIGEKGSVPNTVSRCKPEEEIAHCKIVFDEKGMMQIVNMKPQNVTYVNGIAVENKRITEDSKIVLGKDMFPIQLSEILEIASKSLKQEIVKKEGYSIKHLSSVWDQYHKELLEIKKRQKNIGLLRSIPILFSMLGGVITALVGSEYRFIPLIFTMVAVLIMVYGFYLSLTDDSLDKVEKLTEKFQDQYVCPNDKCQHFLGNQPYSLVRKNKTCPYCKCKFTEK